MFIRITAIIKNIYNISTGRGSLRGILPLIKNLKIRFHRAQNLPRRSSLRLCN